MSEIAWLTRILSLTLVFLCTDYLRAASAFGATEAGSPVKIEMQVLLLDLMNIDSSDQTFTANVAMIARWHDPSLVGSVAEPEAVPLNEHWHPTLQIVNQLSVSKTMDQSLLVHPDGTILLRQRFLGEFTQPVDLRDFPLDTQLLEIRVNAVGSRTDQVQFVAAEGGITGVADKLTISDWQARGYRLDTTPFQAMSGLEPVPSFAFQVEVSRLRGYYALKIFVPLVLIVGMSYLALWVPVPTTNTRVSVSVTSMLTLIAYRFMIGGLLPKISYMTRLDTFVLLSTILVFITLLVVVLTGSWESDRPDKAAGVNRIARLGFPCVFVLIIIFAALG